MYGKVEGGNTTVHSVSVQYIHSTRCPVVAALSAIIEINFLAWQEGGGGERKSAWQRVIGFCTVQLACSMGMLLLCWLPPLSIKGTSSWACLTLIVLPTNEKPVALLSCHKGPWPSPCISSPPTMASSYFPRAEALLDWRRFPLSCACKKVVGQSGINVSLFPVPASAWTCQPGNSMLEAMTFCRAESCQFRD